VQRPAVHNTLMPRAVAIALIASTLLSCTSSPVRWAADGIRASDERQLIERGRYLVYGPAHCASCHGDTLAGGRRFDLGIVGTAIAPNITSDPVAGVGARSDEDLVGSLRYGVSHSGRPLIPFMAFADLADRDLQAIISFLRTVPPVPEAAPPHDLSWFGTLAVNVIMKSRNPKATPPVEIPTERSAAYGHYLAHTVANCHGCHTKRSKLTGAFVGEPFAGGMELMEAGTTFTTPNLTAAEGGLLRTWDEAVRRALPYARKHADTITDAVDGLRSHDGRRARRDLFVSQVVVEQYGISGATDVDRALHEISHQRSSGFGVRFEQEMPAIEDVSSHTPPARTASRLSRASSRCAAMSPGY
jgi:mono/diheme cytochrome c family protein